MKSLKWLALLFVGGCTASGLLLCAIRLCAISHGNVAVLSIGEMRSITAGCGGQECPSTGAYQCVACLCLYTPGVSECSAYKKHDQCVDKPGGPGCVDTIRVCDANGADYESWTPDIGRMCNGASYCDVTNWRGVNPTGQNYCWAAYWGCN